MASCCVNTHLKARGPQGRARMASRTGRRNHNPFLGFGPSDISEWLDQNPSYTTRRSRQHALPGDVPLVVERTTSLSSSDGRGSWP